MSGFARKFAQIKYSLNIFILSMCRITLSDEDQKKIHADESPIYRYLKEDALGQHDTCLGYDQPGCSIMIFEVTQGK